MSKYYQQDQNNNQPIVHRFTVENTDESGYIRKNPLNKVTYYTSSDQEQVRNIYNDITNRINLNESLIGDGNANNYGIGNAVKLNYEKEDELDFITCEDVTDTQMQQYLQNKTHRAFQVEKQKDLYRESENQDGLKTTIKQNIIQRTTTLTPLEKQLEDDQLLREKLIRWAQRSTDGYPECNVIDLSSSWRSGLVFSAILHRNRPELFDYRSCLKNTNRENLEHSFYLYERECGIKRTLHPDEVDTFNQNEKGLFYYIYAIYQKFPNPPFRNPLEDEEKLRKIEEFRSLCANLLQWIRENIRKLNRRDDFSNRLEQMRILQRELNNFRSIEVPPRLAEKQRLIYLYKEAKKYANQLNVRIESEYSQENIDLLWVRLMGSLDDRETAINNEILRLEKLQRLAEQVEIEIRNCENKLDIIEQLIYEEERKVHNLNPLDTHLFNIDQITDMIKSEGERIKQLFSDVQYLREENYYNAPELLRKVQKLHEKWSKLHANFQNILKLLADKRKAALTRPLTEEELIEKYPEFRFLSECIKWVQAKLDKISSAKDFGEDLSSIKRVLEDHLKEHREIENYKINVDKCERNQDLFNGEVLTIYLRMLGRLTKLYGELCDVDNKRLNNLESLLDFVQSVADELAWLNERIDTEMARDWSNTRQLSANLDQQLSKIRIEIERREIKIRKLIERGEHLIRSNHPAKNIVQKYLLELENKWQWAKDIVKCSETHLKHSKDSKDFFDRAAEIEKWLDQTEHELNTTFSKTNVTIDEGERLLKEMQILRQEINSYAKVINDLVLDSKDVVPLKQRKEILNRSLKIRALLTIKKDNLTVKQDELCTLKDNMSSTKWRIVTSLGIEEQLPGVAFIILPPDEFAVNLAEQIKKRYENLIDLWASKYHKLRCNLIMATINILKDWDYDTYINMDPAQRNSIIKALDDDVDKVVREGPPNDPDSKRLQDEMRALKKKFAEFDERYKNEQNDKANAEKLRKFTEATDNLLEELREKERELIEKCLANIPRSISSLKKLTNEFNEFESSVRRLEPRLEQCRRLYNDLAKKTIQSTDKLDELNETWTRLNKTMSYYNERLRELSPSLVIFETCHSLITDAENKLNNRDQTRLLPDIKEILSTLTYNKHNFDQLLPAVDKVRQTVERTRPKQTTNTDVDQFEDDCRILLNKYNLICNELKALCKNLDNFDNNFDKLDQEIASILRHDALKSLISADFDQLRRQKEEFKQLMKQRVEPFHDNLKSLNKFGEELINDLAKLSEYSKIDLVIRDIKSKLQHLNDKWAELQALIKNRGLQLKNALDITNNFWEQMNSVMQRLKELRNTLNEQEEPALEIAEIQHQKDLLQDIKDDLLECRPKVDNVHRIGKQLIEICSEKERPEIRRQIEEMEQLYDLVHQLILKREKLLNDAMEKALAFHKLLQEVLDFLDQAEDRLARIGDISNDADVLKQQIKEIKDLKHDIDGFAYKVDKLNKLGRSILETSTSRQTGAIKESLDEVNRRWNDLLNAVNLREKDLDNALLRLGQFQNALKDFLNWLNKLERQLDNINPDFADVSILEQEKLKLKALIEDISQHKRSIDILNDSGKKLIDNRSNGEDSRSTLNILNDLNDRWEQLNEEAERKRKVLDINLEDAIYLHNELVSLITWINEMDQQISASKPVGGLPETARKQLAEFMKLYEEIESNIPKVEQVIRNVEDRLIGTVEQLTKEFRHNLKTLKSKWDTLLSRANERKSKLELALKEALEFDQQLQSFLQFLDSADDRLDNFGPVSRLIDTLLEQIDEHKTFQDDVADHRDVLMSLDKKATSIKYFCDKSDAAALTKLLNTASTKWEKIITRTQDRARQLDLAYKETRQFFDHYDEIMLFIVEMTEKLKEFNNVSSNDSERIKQLLAKNKDFLRLVNSKQSLYDLTMKLGKQLILKAPKNEQPILQEMLDDLREKWLALQNQIQDKQRKLEDALLMAGQLKDAVKALMDWIDFATQNLSLKNLYGDLDTVNSLIDSHKIFIDELRDREKSLDNVRKTAKDLLETCSREDGEQIKNQLERLEDKFNRLNELSEKKTEILKDALILAERLDNLVHELIEWLSDSEKKLRAVQTLPDEESELMRLIAEHELFLKELNKKKDDKNAVIDLAEEILSKCHPDAVSILNHWITITSSRWEEVVSWSKQRQTKMQEHSSNLKNIFESMTNLMSWLTSSERNLLSAEEKKLPDDSTILEHLLNEHQLFVDEMTSKQPTLEKIVKTFSSNRKGSYYASSSTMIRSKKRSSTPSRDSQLNYSLNVTESTNNQQANEVIEKWRSVWLLSMERLRRIQDKLDRQDDNDGKMNFRDLGDGRKNKDVYRAVPFDRSADNLIDNLIEQQNFSETFTTRSTRPKTEEELIMDEVTQLVNLCRCVNKYKVYHVGDNKYRFGDSAKLRLVRILRNAIMVRVGGGWVSLEEFLIKNDPCRSKVRSIVDVKERFILADGVSQSMSPFLSRSLSASREKLHSSTPSGIKKPECSIKNKESTSDISLSTDDSGSKPQTKTKSLVYTGVSSIPTINRPSSRPTSRASSRPSRTGSEISLDDLHRRPTTNLTRKFTSTTSISNIRR